jgi:hypothetical protein
MSFELSFQKSFDASFGLSFEASDERSNALSFETSDAPCDVTSIEMSDGRSDEVSFRVSVLRYFPASCETSFLASFQRSFEERDKGIERPRDRAAHSGRRPAIGDREEAGRGWAVSLHWRKERPLFSVGVTSRPVCVRLGMIPRDPSIGVGATFGHCGPCQTVRVVSAICGQDQCGQELPRLPLSLSPSIQRKANSCRPTPTW